MFKLFVCKMRGFLKVKICGIYRERFINICARNNIHLWDIKRNKDNIEAYILLKDYNDSKEYLKKTGADIYIIERNGLPFIIKRYRRRYGFVVGFILFFALIYAFTMFIWDINVSGDGVYTEEQIAKDIRDNYVDILTPKKNIDCNKLEKILREKYDKVAWISCDIRGTSLNISITETIDKNEIIKCESPCNIIAIKDGIITDVIVRNGMVTRNKGDEVKKGDVLISGTVNIYNDYDELLETNYVAADGEVYAIVEYNYIDEFDMNSYEKAYTGREKKTYAIMLNQKYIPLGFKNNYDLYDEIINQYKLKMGTSIYLPVCFYEVYSKEYNTNPHILNDEEAKIKAEKRLNTYIDDLRKKGVEILENNVKILIIDGKCVSQGTIITKELIGVPDELTLINQGEEP